MCTQTENESIRKSYVEQLTQSKKYFVVKPREIQEGINKKSGDAEYFYIDKYGMKYIVGYRDLPYLDEYKKLPEIVLYVVKKLTSQIMLTELFKIHWNPEQKKYELIAYSQ